jgi:hypothetical protein
MSSYDVHIGKVINKKCDLQGKGSYLVCTPEKEILEVKSIEGIEGVFVSAKVINDLLYEFCKDTITEFASTDDNKDVYTFSIFTDATHGSYIIYINNLDALNKSVEDAYNRNQKRYSRKKEQVYYEFKFAEGDYDFMFDDMPEELEEVLSAYYCVSLNEPDYLQIDKNIIFEKQIVDSQLYLIAIDVIHRLKDDFIELNRTDDFIAYVSSADGDGGDYLTFGQLIRKCVNEDQLYKAIPHLKDKDLAFEDVIRSVDQKTLQDQVNHWISVIDGGEFGEFSINKSWKTDYEAYDCLLRLGIAAAPEIEKLLRTDLNPDTKYIVEIALHDIRSVS